MSQHDETPDPAPDRPAGGDMVIGRIEINRFLTPDGRDLIGVTTTDGAGDRMAIVEALGLLELAKDSVLRESMPGPGDAADEDD